VRPGWRELVVELDTHGQSAVAFAFSKLLGFELLPRLKAIHAQKLYRPDTGQPDAYPNLQPILTRPINWALIREQYDEMAEKAGHRRCSDPAVLRPRQSTIP